MAEQNLLQLTISQVDGPVFEGEVQWVTVPGVAGEMTLLAHHAPLISPLKRGSILFKKSDGEEAHVLVEAGTLEVSHNHATILI